MTLELQAKRNRHDLVRRIRKYMPFYLFMVPAMIVVYLFSYRPLPGIIIAFKRYRMKRGIFGSDWVGLYHFERLFQDPNFYRILTNTLKISILSLLVSFPVTIIFTLLVNEIWHSRFKKMAQTITYLPNFLSWVVVASFVYQLLSPSTGSINALLVNLGIIKEPIFFMAQGDMFVPIYLIVSLWKNTGYSIVIYLATIAAIDPQLYEAAIIDGANRFQRVWYITLPAMVPLMSTMLILSVGSILSVGFDPIYNLMNPAVYHQADVISTYVYRKGLVEAQYDYTTAIGLFQNVVGLILVFSANFFARKANPESRIF